MLHLLKFVFELDYCTCATSEVSIVFRNGIKVLIYSHYTYVGEGSVTSMAGLLQCRSNCTVTSFHADCLQESTVQYMMVCRCYSVFVIISFLT